MSKCGEFAKGCTSQPREQSLFDDRGFFKTGHQDLPTEHPDARDAWIERFTSFFMVSHSPAGGCLSINTPPWDATCWWRSSSG